MHVNFLVCEKKQAEAIASSCLMLATPLEGGGGGLNNAKHDVGCEIVLEKLPVADGNN